MPSKRAVSSSPRIPALGRPDLLLLGAGAFLALLFLLSMLHFTRGHFSLPLDDSFIFLQYARQAAQGHFLQYNADDPPTTGASSFLYLLILVPGHLLGFHESAFMVYAFLLGVAALFGSLLLMRRIGTLLLDSGTGQAAAWLLLLTGPLLWGFLSGMEVGLFAFLVLLTLYQFICEEAAGAYRRTIWSATALALTRPEGALLAGVLGLILFLRQRGRASLPSLLFAGLPVAAFLLQIGLYALLSGQWAAAGLLAKWRFHAPHTPFWVALQDSLFGYLGFIKGVLAGSLGPRHESAPIAYAGNARQAVFGPLLLVFFLIGVLPGVAREIREKRPSVHSLGLLWFLLGTLFTFTIEEPEAHFFRFQQPFLPLFILFSVLGIRSVAQMTGEKLRGLGPGIFAFYGFFGVLSTLVFVSLYGRSCSDIYHMQISMGRSMADNLPADARVAVNDAGALRYFGHRSIVDLLGLTTPGFAGVRPEQAGTIYEELESLGPSRRPSYFATYPNWVDFSGIDLLRPMHNIKLDATSVVAPELVLYKADWRLAGSGESVRSPALLDSLRGWQETDRVDIADRASEAAHSYRSATWEPGGIEVNHVLRQSYSGMTEPVVVDGGRKVTRSETMSVRLRPGVPALMIMRTSTGLRQHFNVSCNSQHVSEVEFPLVPGLAWGEFVVASIPGEMLRGARQTITTEAIPEGGTVAPILSYHYWFYQPGTR